MRTPATKAVTRVAETRRGPRVVTLTAHGVEIRAKGRRSHYPPVPYEAIEDIAAKLAAAANGTPVPQPRRVRP
jgi:hypothetical protein